MFIRPRRLRKTEILREMVAETQLNKNMFIYPLFVMKGKNIKHEIGAMPGVYHFSTDTLSKEIESEGCRVLAWRVVLKAHLPSILRTPWQMPYAQCVPILATM